MAKLGKRILVKRIQTLEAAAVLRRQGENQLNRRIDNLVELVTEVDQRTDPICCTYCGAMVTRGTVEMHNQWHNRDNDDNSKVARDGVFVLPPPMKKDDR